MTMEDVIIRKQEKLTFDPEIAATAISENRSITNTSQNERSGQSPINPLKGTTDVSKIEIAGRLPDKDPNGSVKRDTTQICCESKPAKYASELQTAEELPTKPLDGPIKTEGSLDTSLLCLETITSADTSKSHVVGQKPSAGLNGSRKPGGVFGTYLASSDIKEGEIARPLPIKPVNGSIKAENNLDTGSRNEPIVAKSENTPKTESCRSPFSIKSPNRFLSRSTGSPLLNSALNRVKVNLTNSCFAKLSDKKDNDNDDLTSLSWLQDSNLLKSITSSSCGSSLSTKSDRSQHFRDLDDDDDNSNCSDDVSFNPLNKDKSTCKPPYSFSMLIFMAIENSPSKRLPVKDIYSWIVDHFPYFESAPLGWKNSVRHNLSLNKCFKKVQKDRSQGVGKGSLWCIDNEYRQNLLQGLRKNQVLAAWRNNDNPFGYTPPPSPGNSFNSSTSHLVESWHSRVDSPFFDDKEFDAAASLCTMGTPKEWRAVEHERIRSQNSTPTDFCSSPTVLNKWRTYIEPLSDDDDESDSSSYCKAAKARKLAASNGRKYTIANILADVGNRSFSRSLKRLRYDDSVDEEFEFHNDSDDDDVSDEEIENNIKKLVERDTLGDSGYSEKGYFSAMLDHTYFKTPKRVKQNSKRRSRNDLNKSSDSDVSFEVEALLSLANAATKQLEQLQEQKVKEIVA